MHKYIDHNHLDIKTQVNAVPIRDWLNRYLKLHDEREMRYECPLCPGHNVEAWVEHNKWICWECRCHERYGADAIGLIRSVFHCSYPDAIFKASNDLGIGPVPNGSVWVPRNPSQQKPVSLDRPEPPVQYPYERSGWATDLLELTEVCHRRLMDKADASARRAWKYLTEDRGLKFDTIRNYKLGYNDTARVFHPPLDLSVDNPKPCVLPCGITIPWLTGPYGISKVTVRNPWAGGAKSMSATGSKSHWLYPHKHPFGPEWRGPVLFVEGEFDALTGMQELEGLVPVFTTGGASSYPTASRDRGFIFNVSHVLVCPDNDMKDASEMLYQKYVELRPATYRMRLPSGVKDLNEALMKGLPIVKWFHEQVRLSPFNINLHDYPGQIIEFPKGFPVSRAF